MMTILKNKLNHLTPAKESKINFIVKGTENYKKQKMKK